MNPLVPIRAAPFLFVNLLHNTRSTIFRRRHADTAINSFNFPKPRNLAPLYSYLPPPLVPLSACATTGTRTDPPIRE